MSFSWNFDTRDICYESEWPPGGVMVHMKPFLSTEWTVLHPFTGTRPLHPCICPEGAQNGQGNFHWVIEKSEGIGKMSLRHEEIMEASGVIILVCWFSNTS